MVPGVLPYATFKPRFAQVVLFLFRCWLLSDTLARACGARIGMIACGEQGSSAPSPPASYHPWGAGERHAFAPRELSTLARGGGMPSPPASYQSWCVGERRERPAKEGDNAEREPSASVSPCGAALSTGCGVGMRCAHSHTATCARWRGGAARTTSESKWGS